MLSGLLVRVIATSVGVISHKAGFQSDMQEFNEVPLRDPSRDAHAIVLTGLPRLLGLVISVEDTELEAP